MQESFCEFVHIRVLLANTSLSQLFTFLCGLFCHKIGNLCQMYFLEFHNFTLICFLSYVEVFFFFSLANKKQRDELSLKDLVVINVYIFWGYHETETWNCVDLVALLTTIFRQKWRKCLSSALCGVHLQNPLPQEIVPVKYYGWTLENMCISIV